jgi:hypothetical protein
MSTELQVVSAGVTALQAWLNLQAVSSEASAYLADLAQGGWTAEKKRAFFAFLQELDDQAQ